MTVQFRAATSGSGGTSTNVVLNRPAGVVEGDLLVAVLGSDRDGTLAAMTAPAGWTERGAHTQTSCGFVKVWTKIAGASEPTSYTFPDSTSADAVGGMLAFHSYDPSAPLAVAPVFASSATAATAHPAPSVTGVDGGMLVTAHFGGANANATRSYTPPSGMTERVDVGPSSWTVLGVNTQSLTAAGATGTKTATCSASVPYITATLVVAPASQVTVDDVTPAGVLVASPDGETVDALDADLVLTDPQPAAVDVASPAGESVGVTVTDSIPAGALATAAEGESVAVGVAADPPAAVLVAAPAGETVVADEPGLPAGAAPHITLWAVTPGTGALVLLPHTLKVDLSPVRNEPGAIRVEYPSHGRNAHLLRAIADTGVRVEVEIWVGGSRFNAMRALLLDFEGDDVAEDSTYELSGHFLEWRLSYAMLQPDPDDERGEVRFAAKTPGHIMRVLMQAAHARGTLTTLGISTFSDTHDSAGTPWPAEASTTIKLSPKVTYLQIVTRLVELGVVEWEVTVEHQLRLFVPGGLGRDLTLRTPKPVILRRGTHLLESSRRKSLRELVTDMYGSGAEGLYRSAFDATARALQGEQIEGFVDANNISDGGALQAYVGKALDTVKQGVLELTHGLVFGSDHPAPVSGFRIGDWLYSDVTGATPERVRVVQWVLSQDVGGVTGAVTLNDLIADRVTRLYRRLNALQGGEAAAGTSVPPPEEDTVAPAAPTGVVASSEWFPDESGLTGYAAVYVSWSAVTTNADGTPITDLAGYRVRWRRAVGPSGPAPWDERAETSQTSDSFTAGAGEPVQVEVAAHDRSGNRSAWSATVEIVTETDTTAPPTPSTPTAAPYLGQLRVGYDGKGSAGEAMPPDTDKIELELSTSAGFEPAATRVVDEFSPNITGERVITDLPYGVGHFVRLVARDRSGNRSGPSGSASAVPEQVVGPDIFDGAVGSAKLADLAVITAKIDNLAVNDAKVGNLSVGKLTAGVLSVAVTNSGIIRSGTTGQRYELDAAALRFYNPSGTQTVQLNGAANWISGEIRSALTGQRFVINPGGAAPNELRWYPDSGNQYGVMTTVTSMSEFFGAQSGLSVKAHSGRADNFSGQLQVYPDYAAMSWGTTSIQTVPHQIGMRAPRYHFAVDQDSEFADDGVIRFGIRDPATLGFVAKTLVEYMVSSFDEPSWRNLTLNAGIALGPNFIGSINGGSTGYIPHRASAFNVFTSTRNTKTDIADLDYPGGALAVLRRAKVQKWRRINEVAAAPPGRPARVHIGPMADDLPPEVVPVDAEQGIAGVDLGGLLGLVHAGVTELAERVDALTAQVNTLTAAGGGRRP